MHSILSAPLSGSIEQEQHNLGSRLPLQVSTPNQDQAVQWGNREAGQGTQPEEQQGGWGGGGIASSLWCLQATAVTNLVKSVS